jgi:hypothetical protein
MKKEKKNQFCNYKFSPERSFSQILAICPHMLHSKLGVVVWCFLTHQNLGSQDRFQIGKNDIHEKLTVKFCVQKRALQ